jgi:predicted Zn-dependent protease
MKSAFLIAMTAALSLAAVGTGCSQTQRVKTETAIAKALISDEQEEQLGAEVKRDLESKGMRYVSDPSIVAYVNSVTGRILPHARKDRPGIAWKVHVIDDPKTVNAFATPGGYLYVYTGLILAASNEAELAGVMAHEAGHVVGRHSARQMVNAFGLNAVIGAALGKDPGLVSQIAAQVVGTGAMLAHSRADETEADEYGVRYASAAGYQPQGLATFFQKLQAQQGKTPKLLTWLSTHPAPGDRSAHIQDVIRRHHLRGSDTGEARLAPIKAKLGGG